MARTAKHTYEPMDYVALSVLAAISGFHAVDAMPRLDTTWWAIAVGFSLFIIGLIIELAVKNPIASSALRAKYWTVSFVISGLLFFSAAVIPYFMSIEWDIFNSSGSGFFAVFFGMLASKLRTMSLIVRSNEAAEEESDQIRKNSFGIKR